MTTDKGDDSVGDKPQHARFEPRPRGDTAGLRKNVRNFRTDLLEELHETIVIHENGCERRISKQRAFIKALVALAIKSDVRAINAIVACTRHFGAAVDDGMPSTVNTEDLDILEAFVNRERKRTDRDTPKLKTKKNG